LRNALIYSLFRRNKGLPAKQAAGRVEALR